ncbi:hypothetical protein ACTXT7_013800 [Hymenolepis weldensis]
MDHLDCIVLRYLFKDKKKSSSNRNVNECLKGNGKTSEETVQYVLYRIAANIVSAAEVYAQIDALTIKKSPERSKARGSITKA